MKMKTLVTIALVGCLGGACGVGSYLFWQNYQYEQELERQKALYEEEQAQRRAEIKNIISNYELFESGINAVEKPEGLDELIFETWKDQAVSDETKALLEEYKTMDEITETYYTEVTSLGNFNNDYSRLLMEINEIDPDYLEKLWDDWDRYDFTIAYPNQDQYQDAPEVISSSLDSLPLIIQWDLDWGYLPYGDLNIAIAGCAPTCISMVYSYLLQDPAITPEVIANLAMDLGMYVYGAGSSHDIFAATAAVYGINCMQIEATVENVNEALEAGMPVILNMVPGIFTKVGHFIVVTGIEDGLWKINDPNSIQRSSQLWDPYVVISEARKAWAFSL